MPAYEEYINLPEDQIPVHAFQKSFDDGYPLDGCNACGMAKDSGVHLRPERELELVAA